VKFGVFLLVVGLVVAFLGICLIVNGEIVLGCMTILVGAVYGYVAGRELLSDRGGVNDRGGV
jgi:hypothetical protein